jgi:hypothetical protein
MKLYRLIIVAFLTVFAFGLTAFTVSAHILQTEASEPGIYEKFISTSNEGLTRFAQSNENGLPNQITGVYVQGVMAFPVVQQPKSDASYVSSTPDTITQFEMASQYHSIGLLAHDYLAGSTFAALQPGNEIYLVYGDGSYKNYRIYEIQKYQALSPNDPYSSFIDLTNGSKLSAENLFYKTYGLGKDTLVLQTCISTSSTPSWGRIFVLARPVEPVQSSSPWYTFPQIKQVLAGGFGN